MNKQFENQLKQTFTAPEPQNRDGFLAKLHYPKAKFSEVFLTQIKYTKPIYWIVTALFLVAIFIITKTQMLDSNHLIVISSILPLFSLFGITELHKSASHNMAEIELSCKYNLAFLVLIRITIIGITSLVLLVVAVVFTRDIGFGLLRNALYIAVPFLTVNFISIWLINHLKSRETLYITMGSTAFISILQMAFSSDLIKLYSENSIGIWIFTCGIIIALLTNEIYKLFKKSEELSWNFA